MDSSPLVSPLQGPCFKDYFLNLFLFNLSSQNASITGSKSFRNLPRHYYVSSLPFLRIPTYYLFQLTVDVGSFKTPTFSFKHILTIFPITFHVFDINFSPVSYFWTKFPISDKTAIRILLLRFVFSTLKQ